MRILFQISLEDVNPTELTYAQFLSGQSAADLQNIIGPAEFRILDDVGKLICKFNHLLLDCVINLASNYKSLRQGEIDEGRLFSIGHEWTWHFSFTRERDSYRLQFKDYKDLVLGAEDFHRTLKEFADFTFLSIEYYYKDIGQNENYRWLKKGVHEDIFMTYGPAEIKL